MDQDLPDTEKFRSALSDVVWRFHTYDQYGKDQNKAIRALRKRAPGYSAGFYQEQFELNLKLLVATIAAVQKAPRDFKPENKYSDFSDIDQDYVMANLRSAFPWLTADALKEHLGMVIYWYYLR